MEKLRHRINASFRAKVLVPVIAVMVLLMGITMFVVNYHIIRQAETDAREALATSADVFRHSQTIRRRNLLLRFHNLPNEPRYKSALQTGDPQTVRVQLASAMTEQQVDFLLFTPNQDALPDGATPVIQKQDPLIPTGAFIDATRKATTSALSGEDSTDTIRVGEKLFDVVSVPVYGTGNTLIGALTFGAEVGAEVAQEFSGATHGPIVLLAGGHVVASTLPDSGSSAQLAALFKDAADPNTVGPLYDVRKTEIAGERFFYSGGRFNTLNRDNSLGFLLLRSYEPELRALHSTQQLLLGVSLAAIIFGSIVVCVLVGRVTEPLRALRASAEAVGKGDFSQHVEIQSEDECGRLGRVFNQMTENVKNSREQLEKTVDTLKTTQAQLIQSEKLSGIGEFIAGVAHELNNPLTSIMGFSELMCEEPDLNSELKEHLGMVRKCAVRCQKIVQALLSFARRSAPERKAVCVNQLIEAASEILTYQLRTSNVDLMLRLDPGLPQAMVDPHQMQQVFVNIINNARQAIEEQQRPGWIKITTEARGFSVVVTIQDSGPGIASENLSKIFDPFFTTKQIGKGTGLGLSMCYGIIRDHGGTITPRSRPGEGATFIIELPVTQVGVNDLDTEGSNGTDFIDSKEGTGKKILVIDDEESILQMIRQTLTLRGYEVDTVLNGETGLRQINQKSYDVMLCDWKMPGLTGREVYEKVYKEDPEKADRFIFITGDVINHRTQKFFEEHKCPCLAKPFSLHEFRGAIRKVLQAD